MNQDRNEPFRYSIGTQQLYNTLFKLLSNRNNEIDIVALNLCTLFRNAMTSSAVSMNDAVAEIAMLVVEIVSLLRINVKPLPRYIVCYYGSYTEGIPDKYKRVSKDIDYTLITDDTPIKPNVWSDVNVVVLPYDQMKLSYKTLLEYINTLPNRHNTIMVSHHPLDYYVSDELLQWAIVQSYTGKIITKPQLNALVFNNETIPFVRSIHILLGDKVDLKPSLPLTKKKELFALCKDNELWLKPEVEINRILEANNFKLTYNI